MHNNKDWKEDYTKVYNHSIGQGAFGKVSLVKCNQNGKLFAMKEINLKQYILKTSVINRSYALDEGYKLIKLNLEHENIIKYHDSYIYDDCIYWIMDYCDGGTLRERILLYIKQNKSIEENLIWYWSMQIMTGIKYIHEKGVIHRDLKPDNIYIHGKKGICKIGDFGFAKLVIESSITDNTTVNFINDNSDQEEDLRYKTLRKKSVKKDEPVVYRLINMSQVGTPSYIPPELRFLIDSHLNYSSIETINESIKLCEKHIYKGDVFSFGCIIYELAFLRPAFENKFLLPDDVYLKANLQIETDPVYSNDLKELIKLSLNKNPQDRPNINELYNSSSVQSRHKHDYIDYYKKQVIPSLIMNTKQNALACITVNIEGFYKPISMKSLKFNQNLIIILANKHVCSNSSTNRIKSNLKLITSTLNTLSTFGVSNPKEEMCTNSNNNNSANENENANYYDEYISVDDEACGGDESKIFIYSEYGHLIKEFNSFLPNEHEPGQRENFNSKIYDFCIDEEHDHLYLSTRKYGILRFRIKENNHYMDEIVLDGKLDLSELHDQDKILPTCLNLIEDETLFKDSFKTTNKRRLIFYDRVCKRIISLKVDLTRQESSCFNLKNLTLIKCNINDGKTLQQQYIRQMVSTSKELICLFDDLSSLLVLDLKTLHKIRSSTIEKSKSIKKNLMCLTLDSADYLYSTNGKSIFNLDYNDFQQKKRISPSIKKGENLSHTISWMTILTNSKLVLLTDALQMENSMLFILKPVSNKNLEKKDF